MRSSLLILISLVSCAGVQKAKRPTKKEVAIIEGHLANNVFPSGLYTMQDNEGSLNIDHESKEGIKFDLRVSAPDNKRCQITGLAKVTNSNATYSVSNCQIEFTYTGIKEILVESQCSKICSTDISLDGLFNDIGDLCSIENLKQTREEFSELLNKGNYQSAIERIGPLVKKCDGPFERNRIVRAQIRNDMAHAAYKIGDKQMCLNMIKNIDSSLDLEPRSYSSYWPEEALEEIRKVSKQVEDNRSLCSK